MPGLHSRRSSPLDRRGRHLAYGLPIVVVVVALAVAALVLMPGGSASRGSGVNARKPIAAHVASVPAIEAGVLPWSLSAPISREIVLPGQGTDITVAGGLTSGQATVGGIFTLDTANGRLTATGTLATPVHDASAASLGAGFSAFGGGSSGSVATVQSVTLSGGSAKATVAGQLPAPRSDSSAVALGNKVYIVGGYTGSAADAAVLATSDGVTFTTVASLPVPVRYAAVAAVGGTIVVVGGEIASGAAAGTASTAIQVVDPAKRTARVVGQLPTPVEGAVAAVLGGTLYVAGGTSGAGGSQVPALNAVWAVDPATGRALAAGTLPQAVSYAGVAISGGRAWIVGGQNGAQMLSTVEMMIPNAAFGTAGAPGAGSPFFGSKLLIADRGNDRLMLLNSSDKIVWRYPGPGEPPPTGGFYFPDDAFFARHGTEIISNQEENHTIVIIGYPSGKLLWTYGHPGVPGSAPGFLNQPDDAYVLRSGQVSVSDAMNDRVLIINPNKTIANQIGTTGEVAHIPGKALAYPNGDTPLANGNFLISEIVGSWVSEYTPTGQDVWSVHLPIAYPSDPQQIGPDLYLIANYASPGGIIEFNRAGQILLQYAPTSGPGELNHPSLAELLPSGVFMANDDYNDRVVAIDPATGALVWQYGVTGVPGTAAGMLNKPDGFDILGPNGSTPTHPSTG